MEQEYEFCLDKWSSRVSRMNRVQMMNALGVGSDEMSELIIQGSLRSACKREFDRIWNEMPDEERLDYYNYLMDGENDGE